MNYSRTLPLISLFSVVTSLSALAGGEGWTSDFAAAQKQAADAGKDLLIDFTGSDWCGWCIKLDEEVFSEQAFKDGVKDKFVLVELDFPNDKSKLNEATQKQNAELEEKYGVKGYPTILLCDAGGKPYASTGYKEGGPEEYVKHLEELRAKKAKADEALKQANASEGVEKAKALVAMLEAMELTDTMIENFYGDVATQIKAADPTDETGFIKAAETKAKLTKFQEELSSFAQEDNFPGALELVNKTINEGGFATDEVQQMIATRAMIFAQMKKFDEALKSLDEAKALAPESETAAQIDVFREKLAAAKAQETGTQEEKPAAE